MSIDPDDRVDSFLANAIAAARDAAADGADDGAATRLRVRESLTQRPPRRRWSIIAAIIGTMVGSTAFAYVGAVKAGWVDAPSFLASSEEPDDSPTTSMALPESATKRTQIAAAPPDIAPELLFEPSPLPSEPVEVAPTPARPPVETPAPAPSVPGKVVVRTPTPRPAPKRAPAPAAIETAPPVTVEPAPIAKAEPPPAPVSEPKPEPKPVPMTPDAELSAYRAAHDLHFKSNDAKAALLAWDAYLAKYPNGKLELEARWDRALVLVKLARYKDARAALQPFANANAGSYRQKEALEILAALKDR
jgi:hypothetical protein